MNRNRNIKVNLTYPNSNESGSKILVVAYDNQEKSIKNKHYGSKILPGTEPSSTRDAQGANDSEDFTSTSGGAIEENPRGGQQYLPPSEPRHIPRYAHRLRRERYERLADGGFDACRRLVCGF